MKNISIYLLFICYLIAHVICPKEMNVFGIEVTAVCFVWESIVVYRKIFDG